MSSAYARDTTFASDPTDTLEQAAGRLREVRALLLAISAGELLAALPEQSPAREFHRIGVCLLEIMSRELEVLIDDLDVWSVAPTRSSTVN